MQFVFRAPKSGGSITHRKRVEGLSRFRDFWRMKISRPVAFAIWFLTTGAWGEERADLEYFPSLLHAAIFRNWDIVPVERVAKVLGTEQRTLLKAGKSMG